MSLHHLPPAADDVLAEQAARWLMRVSDANASIEDDVACKAWRRADPAHERAWQAAVRFWHRDELTLALAETEQGISRRFGSLRPIATVAAGLAIVMAAGLLLTSGSGAWLLADRHAPPYSLLHMTMEDGTRVTLDAGAAIDIDYTSQQRRIVLRRGTVVLEAVSDPQRPLVVETARATVTVIGTRFLVAQEDRQDYVAVQQGRVAVRNRAGIERHLAAGQHLHADAAQMDMLAAADPTSVADFATGWRSYETVPLKTVLAEIGRYRWAPILLADPEVGDLPVTARLQVAEPDRALAALQATMPLQVQSWPGGLLRIRRGH